jgi:hypothetical protein
MLFARGVKRHFTVGVPMSVAAFEQVQTQRVRGSCILLDLFFGHGLRKVSGQQDSPV